MLTQKILSPLTALFLFFVLTATAHTALIDNLDGTVTQTRVDGSRLMWLQDANTAKTSGYDTDGKMTWAIANTWIASLNSANYKGYNDWRLPDTLPVNGVSYDYTYYNYDGSTDLGYNISAPGTVYENSTGSEMAYMYYVELGNLGWYDTSGSGPQSGWGLSNTDIFTNLQSVVYWSGTEYAPIPNVAWLFVFLNGFQNNNLNEDYTAYAWAVREMSAVPEPTSLLLLGSGLVGMLGLKRKWRKQEGYFPNML